MKKNSIGYTINHVTRTIVITKAFSKRASINGTQEFNELVELIQTLQGYKVIEKTIKVNESKQTHNGLTTDKMVEYITQTRGEEATTMLAKMTEVEKMGKLLGSKYAYVKKWFFEECPEYKILVAKVKKLEAEEKANEDTSEEKNAA